MLEEETGANRNEDFRREKWHGRPAPIDRDPARGAAMAKLAIPPSSGGRRSDVPPPRTKMIEKNLTKQVPLSPRLNGNGF